MRKLVQRMAHSAVAWSAVAAAFRSGSALLILPLLLARISPEELGLWYVFVSLGAGAVLLDLGFAHATVRATGYLWAGAHSLLPFGLETIEPIPISDGVTRKPNVALLSRLVASLRLYYLAAALALFVVLAGGGGVWIWQKSAGLTNAHSLRLAFFVYAFGLSLGLANSLWSSLLSGINAVREMQQVAAGSLCFYCGLVVTGLLLDGGIWALVAGSVAAGLSERIIARAIFRSRVKLPPARFDAAVLVLLWPNAWRTAAVGLGAFLVLQANILVCSAFLDLSSTASFGLSLQVVTLLAGLSSVWVTVKLPAIYQLRAQGSLHRIAALFRARVALSLLTFGIGAVVLLSLGELLLRSWATRTHLLAPPLLFALLAIQFLEMHHSLYGELVYSENRNPFVRPSLYSGAAIIALSLYLTPLLGLWGILLSVGLVQLCFNNWWPVRRAIHGLGPAGRHYWRETCTAGLRSSADGAGR